MNCVQAANEYCIKNYGQPYETSISSPARRSTRRTINAAGSEQKLSAGPLSAVEITENAETFLAKYLFIREARRNPKGYLRGLSHTYMTVELVALMTPMIAMGIQWLTALCVSTPPFQALIAVFATMWSCILSGDFVCSALHESCILVGGK